MRVLMIGGSAGDVRCIREALEGFDEPCSVVTAGSLDAGLEALSSRPADAVLLEADMPGVNGLDALEWFQKFAALLPVVIITSADDQEFAMRALRAGAQDYLVRQQLDPVQLRRALKHAVERKRAEKGVRREKEEWELTFNSVPDLMAILDTSHRIIRVNKAMADHLGVNPGECVGQHCYEAVHGLPCPPDSCPHSLTCLDGEEHTADVYEPRMGGDFQVSTTPMFDRNGRVTGSVHIARDITQRKKAEQLKDEFIGMVSHELRTPLTVIIGALAVARSEGVSADESAELIQNAATGADALASLIDNLLELSRYQSDRLNLNSEKVNLGKVAECVVQKLRGKSPRHKLVASIPDSLPGVVIDRVRIERVLMNLVENAIKYSPRGGEVEVFALEHESHVVIGVRDQGIGISKADQSRLFQRFERLQAKERHAIPGLGLGLRVCRILVEAHGGRIWVESAPGQGATFYFTVPLVAAAPAA